MLQDILSAIPLGLLLSIMPGAVFFVLLETSVLKGFKAALAFDLGAVASDVVFILIAYFSSYQLLAKIKDEPALFIFGGLIMFLYGLISFLNVTKSSKNDLVGDAANDIIKRNYFSLFIKGFFLNFINIGVLGFWLGVIIAWGPRLDLNPTRIIIFFTAVVGTYFVVDIGKIMLAKQLRTKLTTENIMKIKKGISLVIMIFGIILLFQGIFPGEVNAVIDNVEKNK
jgi:threonine/homoserine/homoserine lactone efflux protein